MIEVPLYGSSRLGVWRPDREVETTGWELFDTDSMTGTGGGIAGGWERGRVQFELSNHLGNVLVTISDARTAVDDGTYEVFTICHTCLPGIPCVPCFNDYDQQNSTPDGVVDYYLPQVLTANDYYPFGMGMPGRKFAEDESYRYGFNGKENDNDVKGEGNQQDYGMRIYDPRLGRFLSVDPLTKSYPWYTPYQFAGNEPTRAIDLDGEEPKYIHYYKLVGFTPVLESTFVGDINSVGETHNLIVENKIYTSAIYNSSEFPKEIKNSWGAIILAKTGKYNGFGYAGMEISSEGINTIEGLFAYAKSFDDYERSIVNSIPNPEPWNGSYEDQATFFNQITGGMYMGLSSSLFRLQRGANPPPQTRTVQYDKLDVHSVYSDGTKVYKGYSPSKISGPDPAAEGFPHTVLKLDVLRSRIYKAREFGIGGVPNRDFDFTAPTFRNGVIRPGYFTPEQHLWLPNPTGGSMICQRPGTPLKLLSSTLNLRGNQVIQNKNIPGL